MPPDLSQVCSGQAARAANVPTDRIVEALKPTDSQRSALVDVALHDGDSSNDTAPGGHELIVAEL